MKKRLRSFNIYSSRDDNLVLWQLFHFLKIAARSRWIYGADPMEGSKSEWSLVRTLTKCAPTIHRSFSCSPDNTANCAGYSFRPKTTFSLNFLIEHFRFTQGYRNFNFGFLYCYSACMPQGIYFITDTSKARYHVFLFPVPTSINTHFARCLRDTHARLGPLEVCKENNKKNCRFKQHRVILSATRETYTWIIFGNHALRQPRTFSYVVADNWIILTMHWCSELQCDYYNWGYLDKVDQSDHRKITIHSKKVGREPINIIILILLLIII